MTELNVNSSDYVFLNIIQAGSPQNADSTPTVTVTGNGVDLGVHPVITVSTGVYKTLITLADTALETTILVKWTFALATVVSTKTDTYNVITPYISNTTIATKAPVGTSQADLTMAEQFARFTIDQFTNQHFGKAYKTVEAYGQNTDVLLVPERILSVDKLYQNNELVIDVGNMLALGADFPFNIEITDTHWAVRIIPNDFVPIQEYTDVTVLNWPANFRRLYRYKIAGVFGWDSVPSDIQLAALYLAADFFCQDSAWKTKYVQDMQATDWSIEFNGQAYDGTGNFVVDRLLANYKWNTMVIV